MPHCRSEWLEPCSLGCRAFLIRLRLHTAWQPVPLHLRLLDSGADALLHSPSLRFSTSSLS